MTAWLKGAFPEALEDTLPGPLSPPSHAAVKSVVAGKSFRKDYSVADSDECISFIALVL